MNDMPVSRNLIDAALATIKDPETGLGLIQQGQIRSVTCGGNRAQVKLGLTTFSSPLKGDLTAAVSDRLAPLGFSQVETTFEMFDRPAASADPAGSAAKAIIAVGSGKGGVGKSTIAASIAIGLHRAGCKVGLMDADMYGPSIPHLFGINHEPSVVDNKIVPAVVDGMPVISIGFFVPREDAVVWRGPILHQMVTRFLREVRWGDLDYLIIDMPPGTGDVALSLSQVMPPTGAVIVCTPQEVALLDAVKAIAMFRKLNINILGMVENMSGFICPECHKRYDIFGSGGAKRRAEELRVPFLGEVPITMSIREHGDAGTTSATFKDANTAPYLERVVLQLARNVAALTEIKVGTPALPVL